MDDLGHLNRENQQTLQALGPQIEQEPPSAVETEGDVVTNYHGSVNSFSHFGLQFWHE